MDSKLLDGKSSRILVAALMAAALLIRWSVANGPYSGMGKSPMFGDYEAQRHWQEITVNTPVKDWYKSTSDNDLLYWGLDYPPLTAYHSWLLGKIAEIVNSDWVALHKSRGTEGYFHKLFMRYSVLFADLFLFLPALYLSSKRQKSTHVNLETLAFGLFYPGLILIDYGHFQYNNVSLGLFLMAVHFVHQGRSILSSICFCLSLNYKQMELYHSIPFFCFLLGDAMKNGLIPGIFNVIKLGLTVLVTFALCWLPFLTTFEDIQAVFVRLFPVNRGLYEDKVSNFWCAVSPMIKLKDIVSPSGAVKMCAAVTLLWSLPSAIHTLVRPSSRNFKFSCVVVPLAFFLFSFQVHEKSILIPAVSAVLLYSECPFLVTWFLNVSTFSMAPLLVKDGLMLQFYATRYIFMLLSYGWHFKCKTPSLPTQQVVKSLTCSVFHEYAITQAMQLLNPRNFAWHERSHYAENEFAVWLGCLVILTVDNIMGAYGAFMSLTACEVFSFLLCFVQPPERLPDLWPVGISAFACIHFVFFLVMFTILQVKGTVFTADVKKSL